MWLAWSLPAHDPLLAIMWVLSLVVSSLVVVVATDLFCNREHSRLAKVIRALPS